MKFLYLDKKDRVLAWFTPRHTAIAAGVVGILLAIPVWKESVAGKFVLEPVNRAVVRAHVPGTVSRIYVREGERVSRGSELATLSSLPVESSLNDARTKLLLASAQAREAAMKYRGYGNASMEKERSRLEYGQISEMSAALELNAPISGTVLTPKVQEKLGEYLKSGSNFLEIADLTLMRARIYISEYELYKIHAGQTAKLQFEGLLRRRDGQVSLVSARPTEPLPADGEESDSGSGAAPPHQFYFVDIVVENPKESLKPGMTGVARVYGRRRSIGGIGIEGIKDFWGRKLW